jgi:dTMP kinase
MFITFEGIDYSGKTTQAKLLHQYFDSIDKKSVLLREPGGTAISEKIREILLDKVHTEMFPLTEFLLFSAARAQLVKQLILPYLKKGTIVICDRYYDSSTAYQGYGGKLDVKKVVYVNDFATGGLHPDITFLIDLYPKKAFERAMLMNKSIDRMESKKLSFYDSVRKGFRELADKNRKRFVLINGSLPVNEIHNKILKHINKIKS